MLFVRFFLVSFELAYILVVYFSWKDYLAVELEAVELLVVSLQAVFVYTMNSIHN